MPDLRQSVPLARHHIGGGDSSGGVDPPDPPSSPTGHWTDIVLQNIWDQNRRIPVPETMQALDPQLLASMPPFLRQLGAQMGKSTGLQRNPFAIAHVPIWTGESQSKNIFADEPRLMNKPILAHELTHVWQGGRIERPEKKPGIDPAMYDYGGIDGLNKARREGKTIRNFSAEQQGQMMEDYYGYHLAVLEVAKMQGGILYPGQAEWFERQKAAFEPFMQQLSGEPERDKPLDTAPPAPPRPGLPPSDVTHQLELSPIIAGTMAPIPVAPAEKPQKPLTEVRSVSRLTRHHP